MRGIRRSDIGAIDVEDIIAALPEDERAAIDALVAVRLAEEATLQDLRRAFALTQADLARKLGVGQDAVSRLEQRSDMLLSTLRGYVAALGGELALVATFPDRPPVKIEALDWITPERDTAEGATPEEKRRAPASKEAKTVRSRRKTG